MKTAPEPVGPYALDYSRSTLARKVLTLNGRAIGELWAGDAHETVHLLNSTFPQSAKVKKLTKDLERAEKDLRIVNRIGSEWHGGV